MADEVQRLIMQVQNAAEIDRLRSAMQAEMQTLEALNEVLRINGALTAAQEAIQRSAAVAHVEHANRVGTLVEENRNLGASFKFTGASSLQLSYAFQDLFSQQGDLLRGFMAIQNNIPGIVMALGGSQGMAGAIGAVSMAISLAMPAIIHFVSEMKLFGFETDELKAGLAKFVEQLSIFTSESYAAKTAVERLNERIKEIEKKPIKLAVDRLELEAAEAQVKRIKEGMTAFERARLVRSEEEMEAGKVAAATLAEVPGGEMAAVDKLLAAMVRRDQERSTIIREAEAKEKAAKQQIELLEAPATGFETGFEAAQIGVLEDQIKKARRSAEDARLRIEEAAKVEIGKLLEETERGDQAALTRLVGLARETGDEQMQDLAEALADASAERLKQYDEEEKAFNLQNEKARDARFRRALDEQRFRREIAEETNVFKPSAEELAAMEARNNEERRREHRLTPLERERDAAKRQQDLEKAANEADTKRHEEEVKRINSALGEKATLSFEAEMARQEALRMMGQPALTEGQMQFRGQAALATEFQRLGATPAAAAEAARQARERANADLATRQARLAESNLNTQQIAVLNVEALMMEQQRLAERQNTLDQVVRFQQARIQANQRTAQKIRQGGGG